MIPITHEIMLVPNIIDLMGSDEFSITPFESLFYLPRFTLIPPELLTF